VTEERDNYGVEPESGRLGGSSGPGGPTTTMMGSRDENTWSALAHLSIFLNLFTGFLGPVGALVIWAMYKDRSPRVAFHALQSLWYQVAWMVILIGYAFVAFILTLVTFGLASVVMVPLGVLLALVPFVHMAYAAYKVNQGVDYRYPWISDLVGGRRNTGI
jgi:uncharacterized Tic20 family protein